MHAKISDKPLNVAKVVSLVSDDRSGAVVTFTGVVRTTMAASPLQPSTIVLTPMPRRSWQTWSSSAPRAMASTA